MTAPAVKLCRRTKETFQNSVASWKYARVRGHHLAVEIIGLQTRDAYSQRFSTISKKGATEKTPVGASFCQNPSNFANTGTYGVVVYFVSYSNHVFEKSGGQPRFQFLCGANTQKLSRNIGQGVLQKCAIIA